MSLWTSFNWPGLNLEMCAMLPYKRTWHEQENADRPGIYCHPVNNRAWPEQPHSRPTKRHQHLPHTITFSHGKPYTNDNAYPNSRAIRSVASLDARSKSLRCGLI